MNTYNFFCDTQFKNINETNNDFSILLDKNLIIPEDHKAYLKINNVSFLNNLLNISQYHNNDFFEITHEGQTITYELYDGNYNVYNFKDDINAIIKTNHHITLTYDPILSKYSFQTSSGTAILNPCNLKPFFGLTSPIIITTEPTYGNLLDFRSYNKILLTTSLTFNNNPYHNLISSYSSTSGIGSICCWINKNDTPFKTINYNNDDIEHEIVDKNIKNINFKILNEYREVITNMPDIQLQFQIIIKDNYNYKRKIIKILNYILEMMNILYNFNSIFYKK